MCRHRLAGLVESAAVVRVDAEIFLDVPGSHTAQWRRLKLAACDAFANLLIMHQQPLMSADIHEVQARYRARAYSMEKTACDGFIRMSRVTACTHYRQANKRKQTHGQFHCHRHDPRMALTLIGIAAARFAIL